MVDTEQLKERICRAIDGHRREIIALGDCTGKLGETTLLYTSGALPAPRVLVVGLGDRERFDLQAVRTATAKAIAAANKAGAKTVATIVHGAGIGGLDPQDAAQAVAEASMLELYTMPRRSSEGGYGAKIETLTVVEYSSTQLPAITKGVETGRIIAESAILARDLEAQPANIATPTMIAETARQMAAETGLDCTILERADMEALGMGILLAVAKGSDEPPKFVILEHNKARANELDTVVLVGKGVTFDTGGYSLKIARPSLMWKMKDDMTGAADVIAALRAAALLDLPLHVVGLAPLTENTINGRAQKPGDIFTGMTGKTMEVISTDAEGRMPPCMEACPNHQHARDYIRFIMQRQYLLGLQTQSAQARLLARAALSSGDPRWALRSPGEIEAVTRTDIQKALTKIAQTLRVLLLGPTPVSKTIIHP